MANQNKTTIIAEPGKQEMTITREFDAPRELVFKEITFAMGTVEPGGAARWRF